MKSRHAGFAAGVLFSGLSVAVVLASQPQANPSDPEPTYQIAKGWWSELSKKWTPVGWKNHLFRYNVLFNGAIVAEPHLNRRTAGWAGQGVLVWPSLANPTDDGTTGQGWVPDHETPVLWTDWSGSPFENRAQGVRFRQEVFAVVPGAAEVNTGAEPLLAWIRLSVEWVDKADAPTKYTFSYKLHGPAIGRSMVGKGNLRYAWQPYPRPLALEPASDAAPCAMLREPDGNVRLAVGAKKGCRVELRTSEKTPRLDIEFDVRQGNSVELLLPMVPTPPDVVAKQCQLGFEQSLSMADACWRRRPATAATVDVPEEEITRAIRQHLNMAEIVAEKDPATGEYCSLTGSWTYADVWSTPNAMLPALLLDPLGYHAQAERYLAVFARHQGTTLPPGKAYRPHPGYLGTPKVYQAINWLSDNGALLWAFSEHGLFTGDEKFIGAYTPVILKSCEWIRDSRRSTGHGGIEKILPGAVATDERQEVQSIWNDGWNYKGLSTAVRLLKRTRHPRAAEFQAEAHDYREQFRRAYFEAARKTPTWTDASGKTRAMAPRNLSGDKTWGLNHAFYLDVGPLFLVFAGLVDADEELAVSNRLWFREGPPRKTYEDNGNCWQPPSLQHEISSCEPCYSWVYFHSWQLGDRRKFLEAMYSLFAGASSQQTFTVCETRGGISGVTPCIPSVWLARLAVIDDQLRPEELNLLRLTPLSWLRSDRPMRFENMATEFGPVSLTAGLSADGRELAVTFAASFRAAAPRLVLHVPPVRGLAAIRFNGKPLDWDGRKPSIDIP